jgi:hypothetical protein
MTATSFKGQKRLATLEAELKRAGLEEHLQFARALAAERAPAAKITMMMRGNFSDETIEALILEAKSQAVNTTQ